MIPFRSPDAGECAGQMAFPGNRAGVRHYSVKNPTETDEHEQRDNRRAPALHQKARDDEIGNETENDRTGTDMNDGAAVVRTPADQP